MMKKILLSCFCVMTYTFAQFTDADAPIYLPGAPFLLAATLSTLGLAAILIGTRRGS